MIDLLGIHAEQSIHIFSPLNQQLNNTHDLRLIHNNFK